MLHSNETRCEVNFYRSIPTADARSVSGSSPLFCFVLMMQIKYSESKKVNMTDFRLVENKNFNNLPVNLTMSTVHVPSSLYDRCKCCAHSVFLYWLAFFFLFFLLYFHLGVFVVDEF